MDEHTVIITPAMRTAIEELAKLIVGSLPGYKIADIALNIRMEAEAPSQPSEQRSTMHVLCRHPHRRQQ